MYGLGQFTLIYIDFRSKEQSNQPCSRLKGFYTCMQNNELQIKYVLKALVLPRLC